MALGYALPPESLAARLRAISPMLVDTETPGPVLQFAPFMPDRTPLGSQGSPNVINAIPIPDGYGPVKDFATVASSALTARAQGGTAVQDAGGVVRVFAGDAGKLYLIDVGGTVNDVSKSGGYSTGADEAWEFALDGQTVIATNYADPVQSYTLGTSTLFADHLTSTLKPKMRHMDTIREFLVGGNTDDATDAVKTARIWWSGIGDTKDLDPAANTQSDFQDVRGVGQNQRIVGGVEYGLAFFESAIERMTYVGAGEVFRFDRIDRKRGTDIPNSVIAHGRRVFFHSPEGFMVNHGAGESEHIGHGKVDKWFDDQFDTADLSRMSAAIFPLEKSVAWLFPGTGNVDAVPNIIAFYNYAEDKWGEAEITLQILIRALSLGFTLEQLDTISTSLDLLPSSLDSKAWQGGRTIPAGFNSSRVYGTFSGANLQATIDTGERMINPGYFSRVSGMVPLVDGGTVTGGIGGRDRQIDSVSFDTAQSLNSDGIIPAENSSRYHRARIVIAAGGTWNRAQGVQFLSAREGHY